MRSLLINHLRYNISRWSELSEPFIICLALVSLRCWLRRATYIRHSFRCSRFNVKFNLILVSRRRSVWVFQVEILTFDYGFCVKSPHHWSLRNFIYTSFGHEHQITTAICPWGCRVCRALSIHYWRETFRHATFHVCFLLDVLQG